MNAYVSHGDDVGGGSRHSIAMYAKGHGTHDKF